MKINHTSCMHESHKWYKEKLFLVILFLIVLVTLQAILNSFGIQALNNLVSTFSNYLGMVWLPISIGVLLGGLIEYYIPKEYISKFLSTTKKSTIFYSVILGFMMSGCSHGILAIAIELYKKGASVPAVISFLLATPWANFTITLLLFSFFGFKAFLLIGATIIIAIITGLIYQVLDKKGLIEPSKNIAQVEKDFSIINDIKSRLKNYKPSLITLKNDFHGVLNGTWSLAKMVVWWLLIGVLLASIASTYIPHEFFSKYMGPTLLGLVVTLALATAIEICSEGSAPLAFEVYKQTNAFGNSFTLLTGGVVTDYTEIGLIWSNIGKKAAIWLPIVTVPQVLLIGYLFNILVK